MALCETAEGKTIAKNTCKGLWDSCRMLTSLRGVRLAVRPDKVTLKPGAKGDCYPFPAGRADGVGVPEGAVVL